MKLGWCIAWVNNVIIWHGNDVIFPNSMTSRLICIRHIEFHDFSNCLKYGQKLSRTSKKSESYCGIIFPFENHTCKSFWTGKCHAGRKMFLSLWKCTIHSQYLMAISLKFQLPVLSYLILNLNTCSAYISETFLRQERKQITSFNALHYKIFI